VRLSKREITLLVLLVVVSGFYLGYHFVFEPLYKHAAQLRDENVKLSTDLQTLEQRMNKKGDISLEEQKIQNEYAKMEAKLPQSPMIPNTIDFMELSAREANVKLLSINYKENVPAKTGVDSKNNQPVSPTAANFKITASGSHYNLLSFLLKLENAPRIYTINGSKITLAKVSSEADTPGQEVGGAGTEAAVETAEALKAAESAKKESQIYDQSKSVINIDFTAYYDSPSTTGQSPAAGVSSKSDSVESVQTNHNTAPAATPETENKSPVLKKEQASGLIHNLAAATVEIKNHAFLKAGSVGRLINRGTQTAEEQFRKLPALKKLIAAGAVKLRELAFVIISQPTLDADIVTWSPEYQGGNMIKLMNYSSL